MVFTVAPHDSQDVQHWHSLGAAQNQLRYQTLNNYLKDMRQMAEERYKEWVKVLNTLYQIYPHVLQAQSPTALETLDKQREAYHKYLQDFPIGTNAQMSIIPTVLMNPTNPPNNQGTGAQLPAAITTTTSQQQGTQQQSGQQPTKQNP
jgi:hypothetical protein